jgi:hypothetical protein
MVTHGAAPLRLTFITIMASLLGSLSILANWYVITKIMTSYLDQLSRMGLNAQARLTIHSTMGNISFLILL